MGDGDSRFRQVSKKLNETGDKLVAFGKKGSLYMAPVALGLGFATKKAADFEQQMSNTLSVMSWRGKSI